MIKHGSRIQKSKRMKLLCNIESIAEDEVKGNTVQQLLVFFIDVFSKNSIKAIYDPDSDYPSYFPF